MQSETPAINVPTDAPKPKGRLVLLLLFIFFAAPLIVVAVMYKLDWHPSGFSRGQMVSPPQFIALPMGLMDANGQPIATDFWKEKWSVLYIADACDSVCEQRLHEMRQIHVSLAKHIPRVQRILLTQSADVQTLQQQYPDLIVINQPASELAALKMQFDLGESLAGQAQRVYVVDPLSYLMMSYPIETPARDIRKDLGRLLAYAWAG